MKKEGYWLDLGNIQLCYFYVPYLLPFLAAAAFIRAIRVRPTCSAPTRDWSSPLTTHSVYVIELSPHQYIPKGTTSWPISDPQISIKAPRFDLGNWYRIVPVLHWYKLRERVKRCVVVDWRLPSSQQFDIPRFQGSSHSRVSLLVARKHSSRFLHQLTSFFFLLQQPINRLKIKN